MALMTFAGIDSRTRAALAGCCAKAAEGFGDLGHLALASKFRQERQ